MVENLRIRIVLAVFVALSLVACGDAPGGNSNSLPDAGVTPDSVLIDGLINGGDTVQGDDVTTSSDVESGEDGTVKIDAGGDATTADDTATATDTTTANDATSSDATSTDAAAGDTTADASSCPGGTGCTCVDNDDCDSKDCRPPAGGGAKVCQPPCVKTTPDTEVCDGLDNDCDGEIDNNSCDDANFCTKDVCEQGSDSKYTCSSTPDKANENCDDGSACTNSDVCTNGKCEGAKIDCDDSNPCTDDSCDPKTGCTNVNNKATCDDGDVCTEGEACADGKCAGGKAKACDDGNSCTKDSCDAAKGCVTTNDDSGKCDDSDPCTENDGCKDGVCSAGSQKACDDKDPCTIDLCDSKTGKCSSEKAKDGGICDDGNPCTDTDVCNGGKCAGKTKTCEDGDPCTKDSCDAKKGCVNTASTGGDCDDANPCTTNDKCDKNGCAGEVKTCDDKNVCTSDSCDPKTGCVNKSVDGKCDDGSKCTATDACKDGACTGSGSKDCDDSNPCTADGCDASTGDCTHKATSGKCDDGSKCTSADACDGGKCTGKLANCDDSNACTTDTCDKDTGCKNTNNTDACDDGNACTDKDICEDGKCVGSPLKADTCDDKNACTKDSCNPKTGCVNTNADGTTCDDGDACTSKDVCKAGKCESGTNTCQCKTSEDCKDDGNLCNGSLICTNNKCVTDPKTVVTCDASKDTSCLTNTCNKGSGKCSLAATNDGKPCKEGSLCTLGNTCAKGSCTNGSKAKCQDGNACTTDLCDAKTGDCSFKSVPNCTACKDASVCDDKNACTKDACIVGKCSNSAIPGCSLKPDLTLGTVKVDKNLYLAGDAIVVNYIVSNIGLGTAANRTDRVYLSKDKVFSKGDILIASSLRGSLASKKIQPISVKTKVPASATSGAWYVLVIVDAANTVNEAKETNNQSAVATKVQGLPDINVTGYKPSTTASFAGGKITFSLKIDNTGAIKAPSTKAQFYISTNPVIDSKDLKPYSWTVPSLDPGKSWTGSRFVLLPKTLANGTYYIGLRADDLKAVLEGDEANNIKWVKIAVGPAPDLQAVAFSSGSTMYAANKYVISMSEKNIGDKNAGAYVDSVYLSTNTSLGSTDVKLLDIPRTGLAKGAATSFKATIKMPAATKTGSYYLIFAVDSANAIAEKTESNNRRYVKINVLGRSDLVPVVTMPDAKGWLPGAKGKVIVRERNLGTGKSGTYYNRIYLSANGVYGSGDVALTSNLVRTALNPSAYSAQSTYTFTIPSSTKPGTYYLLHRTDSTSANIEVSESNNVKAVKVTILAKPDIVLSGAKLSSTAPLAGTSVKVNYTVTNKGGAATGVFSNGFYLSTSATKIVGPLLSTGSVSSLSGGKSAQLTQTVSIPASTKPGTYYLILRGDSGSKVTEGDESNNLLAAKITVQAAKLADLQLVSVKLTSTTTAYRPGQSFTMAVTIKNIGSLSSGTFSLGRYLSVNTLISTGDALLGSTLRPSLAPGASTTFNVTSPIPVTQKAGTIYAGVYADNKFAVKEILESNNKSSALKLTILATPDLAVEKFAPTKTYYKPGETVAFNTLFKNVGNAPSGTFVLATRLSNNTTISTFDKLMKSSTRPSLNAGASSTYNSSFKLPTNTAAGIWYLGVRLDDNTKITEVSESNNISWVKITVQSTTIKKADLIPHLVKPTKTTYIAGQSIAWSGFERNIGNAVATSHDFRVYLSRSPTTLTNSVYLKGISVSLLGVNGSKSIASSTTLPTSLAGGTWYVHFRADHSSKVSEVLESNNVVSEKITVTALADLRSFSMTADKAYYAPGSTVKVNWSEYNLGGASAGAYVTGFYLSTNSTISSSDQLLKSVARSGLASGKNTSLSTTFTISSKTAAGVYYLGVWLDSTGKVSESSNSNNFRTVKITVTSTSTKPDLFGQTLSSTSSSYKAGQTFSVSGVGKNIGKGNAGAFRVGYYLSKDAVITTADTFITSKNVTALAANGSVSLAASVKAPANTKSGLWYIGALLDDQSKVSEGVEGNNYVAKSVYITGVADLAAISISAGEFYAPGAKMIVSVNQKNLGGATAGAHKVGVYLSANSFISRTSDKLLYTFSVPSLVAGATFAKSALVTLPSNTSAGDYFLGMYSDSELKVTEISESNQTASKRFTVTSSSSKPDLTPYLFKTTKTAYKVGDTISWTGSERNIGNSTAGAHTTRVYLCKTTYYTTSSGNCYLMKSFSKSVLAKNATTSIASSWKIPTYVGNGTWYAIASSDHNKQVSESIETNNQRYIKVTVAGLADLQAYSLSLSPSSGLKPGSTVTATFRDRNIGGLDAPKYTSRFYLSTNATLSSADTTLTTVAMPALAKGALGASKKVSMLIPKSTKPGTYYLGYYANYPSATFTETTKTNNTRTVAIIVVANTSKPDLSTTDFKTSATSYKAGSVVYTSGYVKNLGGVSAGAFRISYRLSTDKTINSADTLLRFSNRSSLASGSQSSLSTSLTLPAKLKSGTYYIGVYIDDLNQVSEVSELNNIKYNAITVSASPDLSMEYSRTSKGSYKSGETMFIYTRERNIGGATAGAHEVKCYLSTNSSITKSDTYLGKAAVGPLAANSMSSKTIIAKMPSKSAGVYYVGCVSDIDNKVSESSKSNNTLFNKITVASTSLKPDLTLENMYVTSPNATAGSTIVVNGVARNIGKFKAGAFKVAYYIHNSTYLPSTAKPVYVSSRSGLNVGSPTSITRTLQVPANVLTGSWYVHVRVDYENKVNEAFESNNDWYIKVAVTPVADLIIESLKTNKTGYKNGETVTLTYVLRNVGSADAKAFYTRAYRSSNPIISTGDTFRGSRYETLVGAGQTVTRTISFKMSTLKVGSEHYYGVFADYSNKVPEASNSNNTKASVKIKVL